MKTAIVLSGGGAKGAFQVGVLERLYEQGIKPDVIYGTSVGALNACSTAHQGVEYAKSIWLGIKDRSDILSFNWGFLWSDGIYSMAPLRKLITESIKGIPTTEVKVCTTSLRAGETAYHSSNFLPPEWFALAVEASASIPFFMQPVLGDLVDGGVREQAPLSEAIKDGATDIIAVLCNPVIKDMDDNWMPSWPKTLTNGLRAIDIMEHEVFLNDLKICTSRNSDPRYRKLNIKVYAPTKQLYDTLEFDPVKIRNAIQQGRDTIPYQIGA